MTTTFLLPCEPNKQINVVSTIIKNGKSIVFTEAKMYQEDKLIALSSASNKIINLS
jgi:acyl-coenzyme A thioesterase PaaI-like protein